MLAGREGMEHIAAFNVKSVDSTGAGDAFIGSFAVFRAKAYPKAKQSGGPIFMPDSQLLESELKSRSMIALVMMQVGRREPNPSPDRQALRAAASALPIPLCHISVTSNRDVCG